MNEENNKKLNEKYSDLIQRVEYKGELRPFWFECGDGWYTLIDALCTEIQTAIKNNKQDLDFKKEQGEPVTDEDYETNKVTISQVKEKYGGLRFYVYGDNDHIRGMIDFAETMSYKICETCGNPGTLSQKGWWRTQCEPCRADEQKQTEEWNKNYKEAANRLDEENNVK
jgi:hypothetical protein